jgi:hypothetical protein
MFTSIGLFLDIVGAKLIITSTKPAPTILFQVNDFPQSAPGAFEFPSS